MNEQLEKLFGPNFKLHDIDVAPAVNNLGLLSLNLLESNKIFKFLKSELELYYKERKKHPHRQTLHPHRSQAWKEHFYLSLQSLLNEITYTSDQMIKDHLTTKIYRWYSEKSQRTIEVPRTKMPLKVTEELCIPYIPEEIESTKVHLRQCIRLPNIPKAINLTKDLTLTSDASTLPLILEASPNGSPTRTSRSRHFFRPFRKTQKDPVLLDFRASSTGDSIENQRSTNYSDREYIEKNSIKDSIDAKVPFIRRQQLKEISIIKQRLAAKNLSLPYRVLENGLVFSDFSQKIMPPMMLPKGGELLMEGIEIELPAKKKKKKNQGK